MVNALAFVKTHVSIFSRVQFLTGCALLVPGKFFHVKTNFNESLINIKSLNCIPSLISFCETNLDEDDIHDFNMTDYNAEHLYAIPGKKKGSGLSIYSHKTNLFRRISSLTI